MVERPPYLHMRNVPAFVGRVETLTRMPPSFGCQRKGVNHVEMPRPCQLHAHPVKQFRSAGQNLSTDSEDKHSQTWDVKLVHRHGTFCKLGGTQRTLLTSSADSSLSKSSGPATESSSRADGGLKCTVDAESCSPIVVETCRPASRRWAMKRHVSIGTRL